MRYSLVRQTTNRRTMESQNGNGRRDEIEVALLRRSYSELEDLARLHGIPLPRRKDGRARAVAVLAQDPSIRSEVWIGEREWAEDNTTDDPVPMLVGTAGAAAILDVERPRIGRWVARGHMPRPAVWLDSGPVWRRDSIERMRPRVTRRRARA